MWTTILYFDEQIGCDDKFYLSLIVLITKSIP